MTDTWHSVKTPRPGCLHCEESMSGGHYQCADRHPCQDCADDALTFAEDAAYADSGDDGSLGERDTDLEHPWNMYA